MSKQKQGQVAEKVDDTRRKAAEGTTKPLPVGKPATTPEEKAIDDKNIAMAAKQTREIEEARKKLEELKKQYEEARKKERDARDKEKNAKKAEKEKALIERMKKEKEIEAADALVVAAQKDLEATEEWKLLKKAQARREAIGPLPKVPRGGGGGKRSSSARASNGLTGKMVKILSVMKAGQQYGSANLAELTGILKGKPLPEMEELGLLEVRVPPEGERGKRFLITKKGQEELAKAVAEE